MQKVGYMYLQYLFEHLILSLNSLIVSIVIGIPLGYICYGNRHMNMYITSGIQFLRIIPSLALLFILIPFIGTGYLPALVALVILGIPPVLLNTAVGFSEVSEELLQVGKGLGMDKKQLFKKVLFPLAFPYILNGIKLSLVEIIASATLATYIGAGGLGSLIFTGLGLYRMDLIVVGGVSVAAMSIGVSILFDMIIRKTENRKQKK